MLHGDATSERLVYVTLPQLRTLARMLEDPSLVFTKTQPPGIQGFNVCLDLGTRLDVDSIEADSSSETIAPDGTLNPSDRHHGELPEPAPKDRYGTPIWGDYPSVSVTLRQVSAIIRLWRRNYKGERIALVAGPQQTPEGLVGANMIYTLGTRTPSGKLVNYLVRPLGSVSVSHSTYVRKMQRRFVANLNPAPASISKEHNKAVTRTRS